VNDDGAAGINKALDVSGDSPTNADVVGGALTAGKVAVPWAIFRQKTSGTDQVFVRSFAGGAWTTRGSGTVGGKSSAAPASKGSLNFNQGSDGEAPEIDFAGAGRTVPWATWYENTSGGGFNADNIFASRFDNTQDVNQGKWIFGGQGRGTVGGVEVPSINIHTNEDAQNPSVAGGSAVDATKPGPWITWQEKDTAPVNDVDQIFVVRPEGPGMANCDGVTPAGEPIGGHVPSVGGFCWQQTGIGRVGTGSADPSLNVDPTRNGVEPDIAFTGNNDSVPWVVWYEEDPTHIGGLHSNQMVFAAKGLSTPTPNTGGFDWTVVGSQGSGLLDAGGVNHFGSCGETADAEAACSLNKNPDADAENPQVAAGTMNPANPTVPWVAWDEKLNNVNQVFVSRLVGTGPTAHFELVNNGAPLSVGANDSTRPDITFSGNTPYVSWREDTGGGVEKAFVGHFVNAANPTFVLDESNVPLTPTSQADVREPISSGCTANPFNNNGQACQGGALGSPFFLFTNGTSPRGLFADAYQPDTPVTGAATGVGTTGATLAGTVNPNGASVKVFFQYGTSTAYGQSTPPQPTGPTTVPTPFGAALSGLPSQTVIHFRAVAVSDFGTFTGADQTFTTTSATSSGTVVVGRATTSGKTATVPVSCSGPTGATCALGFRLSVTETLRGHKVIAVSARAARGKPKKHKKVVRVGSATTNLSAGQSQTVSIALNGAGRRLLKGRKSIKATLTVTQTLIGGTTTTLSRQTVSFKGKKKKHKRKSRH
jgi:hypothetical protein